MTIVVNFGPSSISNFMAKSSEKNLVGSTGEVSGSISDVPEKDLLPIIQVEGNNGPMSRIYALMRGHGCKGCKTKEYNGGVPSCHDTANGEFDDERTQVSEGCGYICCQINPGEEIGEGNSIITEPGETDSKKKSNHLEDVGTYKGVKLITCTTGQCDGDIDIKPKDCSRYPFLPVLKGNMLSFQHGDPKKCSMPEADRILHLGYVIMSVLQSIKANPASRNTFSYGHEKMVGYEDYDVSYLADTTPEQMLEKANAHIEAASLREETRIAAFAPNGTSEVDKQQWVAQFRGDMEAMRDMNLKYYAELQDLGVVFTEDGINLDKTTGSR